ncbi:MAG: DHH family phosphoesterase [Flavobacteriales bacterium]|nr:DHH family phosphoesterase [Flavobacteriales bacterium]
MLSKSDIEKIKLVLAPGTNVVISTHKSPDGDAIGSSCALAMYLEKKGCNCSIVVPDALADFLSFIPYSDNIIVHDNMESKAQELLSDSDVVFSLDYNDLKRAGSFGALIADSKSFKILIDHHEEPNYDGDIYYNDSTCCSTAQLVFDLIDELDDLELVDVPIAEAIYFGLITDTGSFRFPSVNERTHEIIAHFLKIGLAHYKVHEAIFDHNSINRLQLNGFAISERLELLQNGRVAFIWLEEEDLKRFSAEKGDTEGLVNKALSISGVQMAAFFRSAKEMVKISFRSKGTVFVNELARDHFNGGGHKYAAGGSSEVAIIDTIAKFKKVVEDYV